MVCNKCGTKNEDDSKFCQNCGTKLEFIPDNIEDSNNIDAKEQPSDNNSNKKTIIIIVLIVVLVLILAVYFLCNKSDKNSNSNENSNKEPDSNEVSNIESNVTSNIDSNITSNPISNNPISNITSNSNSNTVTYGGYIIYVPPTYTINSTNPTLQLIGKNDRDFVVITIEEASYSAIKASPKVIQDHVQQRQMVCNNIRTSMYNGVEFTTAEINDNGMNMILGYAEIDNTHVLGIMVANVNYTIDYTQLNTFANVIKTMKKA